MRIRIDIPHHPYYIQIEKGCLAQAGQWLRELWQPQKVVIVTDNHVASLYAEKVKLSLEDASVLQERIAESDLLVNATSVGMDGKASTVPESIVLPEALLVADIIYQPFETPFLKWARSQGNPAVNGLGMLLYQAAEAFQLWTGKEMPTEEIWQSLTEKYK